MFYSSIKTQQLLSFIKDTNHVAAKAMLARDPLLMFQCAPLFKNTYGLSGTTTPLKFVTYLLDAGMLKIFRERIESNPVNAREFLKQVREQRNQGCIDLRPFFAAYQDYYDKYSVWHLSSEQASAWRNIGRNQFEVLPRHMLKDFCSSGKNPGTDKTSFELVPCPVSIQYMHNGVLYDERETGVMRKLNGHPLLRSIVNQVAYFNGALTHI